MLHLGVSVNGCRMTDYKADGVIVSTAQAPQLIPYLLGGPVINPAVKALLITPICPHNFGGASYGYLR